MNLFQRYAIPVMLTTAFAVAILTVGNTLAVIQNRQNHEIEAIRFLMSAATAHGHALRPNPVAAQPATTLI